MNEWISDDGSVYICLHHINSISSSCIGIALYCIGQQLFVFFLILYSFIPHLTLIFLKNFTLVCLYVSCFPPLSSFSLSVSPSLPLHTLTHRFYKDIDVLSLSIKYYTFHWPPKSLIFFNMITVFHFSLYFVFHSHSHSTHLLLLIFFFSLIFVCLLISKWCSNHVVTWYDSYYTCNAIVDYVSI